ncbi:hypothetical protein DV737_g1528, partial [Chaetothyriales sp. CBS 132003]
MAPTSVILATITAVVGLFTSTATAQTNDTEIVTITDYAAGPLHQAAVNEFLGCINAVGITYQMYVDSDGTIVILPPAGDARDIDLEGTDSALGQCMKNATTTILIVAESTAEYNENEQNANGLDDISYQWLLDQGGNGVMANRPPTMVLEATMIVLDNSEASRNGDYLPDRFKAQSEVLSLIFNAKTSANPESAVGLMSMAGTGPTVLNTPTTNYGALLQGIHTTKIKGHIHLGTAISVAMLALKHRANKAQRQRIVVLICSKLDQKFGDKNDTEKELVKLAKKCKKNNVSVDFVAFGDATGSETRSVLDKFVEAVDSSSSGGSAEAAAARSNSGEGSYLAVIPPGPGLLSDSLFATPIVSMGGDMGGQGGAMDGVETGGVSGQGGAFEFDVDPSTDPELAMVLRMSMEEEENRLARERQEREAQERQNDASSSASKQPTVEDDEKKEGGGA